MEEQSNSRIESEEDSNSINASLILQDGQTTNFQNEWAKLSLKIREADENLERFKQKKASVDKKLRCVTVAVEALSTEIQQCLKS